MRCYKFLLEKVKKIVNSPTFKFVNRLLLVVSVMVVWNHVFADTPTDDPLAGSDKGLIATMSSGGAGRTSAFIMEGIVGVATFIKTKNFLMMFGGVVAIELFLRIVFKFAGVAM